MTPKEKAEELVNKFLQYADTFHNGNMYNAKQCALIAVDEILNITLFYFEDEKKYWQQVKQEIEKL